MNRITARFSSHLTTRLGPRIVRRLWPPHTEQRIKEDLEEFVAERVAPVLQPGGGPLAAYEVEEGNIAIVRRLEPAAGTGTGAEKKPGAPGAWYLRVWPWNPYRSRVREHCAVSELFREAGVRVPEVVLRDDSFATMRRWRIEAVVETEAGGVRADLFETEEGGSASGEAGTEGAVGVRADAAVADLATGLARMHSARCEEWGKPWLPGNPMADPEEFVRSRVRKFRQRTDGRLLTLDRGAFEECLDWIEARSAGLARPARPSLIHGDLSPGNLFVRPDGRVTWIDFGSAQYGMPEQDLALAAFMFGEGEVWERFMAAYERERGVAANGEGGAPADPGAITFHMILRMAEKISSRSRSRARAGARGADAKVLEEDQARAERILRRLLERR